MHQRLSLKDTLEYISGRVNETLVESDLQAASSEASSGDWWDRVDDALATVLDLWKSETLAKYTSDQSRDQLEGVLAVALHERFRGLPASVLTDRDFWRYCSAYLYEMVVWRQPAKTVTSLYPYFGAASQAIGTDCVPHRMFNRAHISHAGAPNNSEDPYELATFGAADVWKSHILRVRNSYAPIVVRELLLDVKSGELPTDPVRLLAKNLKRVRSNVLFEVLDAHQARELMDREKGRVKDMLAAALDSSAAAG